jgi:hypothetical protein
LSNPRDHPRNFEVSFEKLYKTSGLTVEQKGARKIDSQPPKMR